MDTKSTFVPALLLAVVLASPSISFASSKPVKASAPLGADEVAIYKAILQQYSANDSGTLNVSATTVPLNPDSPTTSLQRDGCLQGIQLENLYGASHLFHELPPDILAGTKAKLVDPKRHAKIAHANDPDKTIREGKSVEDAVRGAFASGLFSMTEIAFDKDRHHAVVSYSFWCGSLWQNGGLRERQRGMAKRELDVWGLDFPIDNCCNIEIALKTPEKAKEKRTLVTSPGFANHLALVTFFGETC